MDPAKFWGNASKTLGILAFTTYLFSYVFIALLAKGFGGTLRISAMTGITITGLLVIGALLAGVTTLNMKDKQNLSRRKNVFRRPG